MAKKLIILIHKYTDECIVVKSKRDLAEILCVSTRTISRRYPESKCYVLEPYKLIMNVDVYQTERKMNYKTDVVPPIRKPEND